MRQRFRYLDAVTHGDIIPGSDRRTGTTAASLLGTADGPRVTSIDLARTAAIGGMVAFHLVRDLEIFGLVVPGTTLTGGWAAFARIVAGSFLFLSGTSLVLAHGTQVRWRSFFARLLVIGGAAAAVTLATVLAVPERFIYFGILHTIALASVVAIVFVRAPPWASAAGAMAVWLVYLWIGRSLDLPLWLGWTGLGRYTRPSLDLIPFIPWLAPCLLGVCFGRWMLPYWANRATPPTAVQEIFAGPGRHSLAIYLVHQPVLLATIWLLVETGAVE